MSGDHARIEALLDRLVKLKLENKYQLVGDAFDGFKKELSKHFVVEEEAIFKFIKPANENIHSHGRLFNADEIIKKACGEGLNSKVYVNYLKNKFFPLYGLD